VRQFKFLTIERILYLHRQMVALYGGSLRIWDYGKLESAVAAPKQSYGGVRAHETVYEVAAAYLFHISQAHSFEAANKRTGAIACIEFLEENGYTLEPGEKTLFELANDVASSKMSEKDVADWVEKYTFQK